MSGRALDPALRRVLLAARAKREERGATGDGTVVTPRLEPHEALALDGLLAPRRPVLAGRQLRVPLSRLEAALRDSGIDPRGAYEHVGDEPLRDRPAERAAAGQTRGELRRWLRSHEVARRHPPLAAWLDEAARQGRIGPDTRPSRSAPCASSARCRRPRRSSEPSWPPSSSAAIRTGWTRTRRCTG